MRVFLFGAALDPRVAAALGVGSGEPAMLGGIKAVARDDGFGALLRPGQGEVKGAVTEAAPIFAALMDVFGAEGRVVRPETVAFGWTQDDGPNWDLGAWSDIWAPIMAATVERVISLLPDYSVDQLRRSLPQIAVRAASEARAAAERTPTQIRQGFTSADVKTDAQASPYLDYFAVEEQHVRFRHFDGSLSTSVKRAAFVSGDAVTVLPYDPRRDRVLVIEQFRFGPYLRKDPQPWSLEPIAGRIDPGETPEDCARREAIEETGLSVDALHRIAAYYPSPGAVTEYLFSYIGLADLPDEAARIGGLACEAEDIRGIVLEFADLMALLSSGEAQNGPLILSALWLQAHRERLRAAP